MTNSIDSLIEKLQGEKYIYGEHPEAKLWNEALDLAIAIIRQHTAAPDVVDKVFMNAFRAGATGTINSNIRKRIKRGLSAIAAMNMGEGSATIAPLSAETVQPITPANHNPLGCEFSERNQHEQVIAKDHKMADAQKYSLPSEISDVMLNMKSMIAAEEACENAYGESSHQLMKALHAGVIAYLRATEPVSLKDAANNISRLHNTVFKNTPENCKILAQYALKGVWVKYVD